MGDVAIRGDKIAAIGDLSADRGKKEIRVAGLAVAPGFINMMCWANETLIEDGRSQSDIRQGVTLEVMGEGNSMGPLNDRMKQDMLKQEGDIKYAIEWTTLGEYFQFLERRGVSTNVASFIGAATPRKCVIGNDNRPPTADELERCRTWFARPCGRVPWAWRCIASSAGKFRQDGRSHRALQGGSGV